MAPDVSAHVPAGHGLQALAAGLGAKVPGLHGAHCHDPSALALLPGAQGWQLPAEWAPGEGEKRPAGHGVAVPAALPEAHTDPAGHSVKVRRAATPEYCRA